MQSQLVLPFINNFSQHKPVELEMTRLENGVEVKFNQTWYLPPRPKLEEIDLAIVHKNCYDGAEAARLVRRRFGKKVEIQFHQYNDPLPDVTGRHVAVFDFSWERLPLLTMMESARSFILLDHHDTGEERLAGIPNAIFDKSKCGAMLAHEYLFPNEEPSMMTRYIQEGDLWTWRIRGSRDFRRALSQFEISTEGMQNAFETPIPDMLKSGKRIYGQQLRIFQREFPNVRVYESNGIQFGLVDSPDDLFKMRSEFSDYVFKKLHLDFIGVAIQKKGGSDYVISLRRRGKTERVRVNDIAKAFSIDTGAGGHPVAAGMRWDKSLEELASEFQQYFLKS